MENFRKPDLNKPRYKAPRKNLHDKDFMKALYEKYPAFKKYKKSDIIGLIRKFNAEKVVDEVVNTREGVDLYQGIGRLFIGSCQVSKKDNIDYGKSIKYGMLVRHKNWETDGQLGKIFYTNVNVKYRIEDSTLWIFKPARLFKRLVAKVFPENWKMYVDIDGKNYVSDLHKSKSYKSKKDVSQDYNEFE
jgi:hypothetical protein